jgi:hypothetical protein
VVNYLAILATIQIDMLKPTITLLEILQDMPHAPVFYCPELAMLHAMQHNVLAQTYARLNRPGHI